MIAVMFLCQIYEWRRIVRVKGIYSLGEETSQFKVLIHFDSCHPTVIFCDTSGGC